MVAMITLTERAASKVREVIAEQEQAYSGIRVAALGCGCSGFQYAMNLENAGQDGDEIFETGGLKVFVDDQSAVHLDGTEIDYVETSEGAGFIFNQPEAEGGCGCGGGSCGC